MAERWVIILRQMNRVNLRSLQPMQALKGERKSLCGYGININHWRFSWNWMDSNSLTMRAIEPERNQQTEKDERVKTDRSTTVSTHEANLMCPAQTPVMDKHCHLLAACIMRMINTVCGWSTSGNVDTDTCWSSMLPLVQTKRAFFHSQDAATTIYPSCLCLKIPSFRKEHLSDSVFRRL